MRHAEDYGLGDVGMCEQDAFDLGREDVEAADVDELLRPSGDSQPAALERG